MFDEQPEQHKTLVLLIGGSWFPINFIQIIHSWQPHLTNHGDLVQVFHNDGSQEMYVIKNCLLNIN